MRSISQWKLTDQVKFGASANAKSLNAAAEKGNRYHRKVYKALQLNVQHNSAYAGWELHVEPWFRNLDGSRETCSPDSVLVHRERGLALVIEVKLNFAKGKDEKLLTKYLPVVQSAFDLRAKPLLIVGCLRGCKTPPLHGLQNIFSALDWLPGAETPVAMVL